MFRHRVIAIARCVADRNAARHGLVEVDEIGRTGAQIGDHFQLLRRAHDLHGQIPADHERGRARDARLVVLGVGGQALVQGKCP